MAQFSHLIFDLDGTLVDTKADLAAATNYMLEALGLPLITLEQVTGYVGNGARVLVEKALGATNAHLVARGFDLFMHYYSAHLLDQTRLYPGLDSVLKTLHADGIIFSLLTNKPEIASRAILAGLQLESLFTTIIGGDTLPTKKPDPQGVRYLQRQTGIALRDTLLIGDSRVDYETGAAAGVAVCGVTWGFGAEDLLMGAPRFLVDTPAQLQTLILA